MKIIAIVICLFFAGCGGDGGDSAEDGPETYSLVCEHDGDVWLCNEQNSCIRDESTEEVFVEEDGEMKIGYKMESGAITIIAECGSNVTFVTSEETRYDTNNY